MIVVVFALCGVGMSIQFGFCLVAWKITEIGYCTSFHLVMKAIIFMHVHNYTRISKL